MQAWWPSPPWKGRCRHRGRALAQQGVFPPVRNVAAISACGLTVCTSPCEPGQIRFVLLRDLGDAYVSGEVTQDDIVAAIEALRAPV